MKRAIFAALLGALPCSAFAQSIPQMDRRVTLAGPTGLNWALSTKADTNNAVMTNAKLGAVQINIAGTQGVANAPTGNPISTFSSSVLATTAQHTAQREFASVIGITSAVGSGLTGQETGNKVALYTGADCQAGSGDCWSINPLLSIDSGNKSAGQGIEVDVNNWDSDRRPFTPGVNQISGVTVTGAGTYESSYAYGVSGPNNPLWHDGYAVFNNSVSDNSFHDIGNAATSINIAGSHQYAIDTSSASSGEAMRFNTEQNITMLVPGSTPETEVIAGDSGRNLYVGGSAASVNIGSSKYNANYFNFAPGVSAGTSPTLKVSGTDTNINLPILTKGAGGCFTLNADETGTGNGVVPYLSACPASGVSVTTLVVTSSDVPTLNASCTAGTMRPGRDGYFYVCDPQNSTWGRVAIGHS